MQTYANGRQIMKPNAGAAQVAVGGADVFALVALRPHLRSVAATLRHPHVAVAGQGADAALASVAGAAVWLGGRGRAPAPPGPRSGWPPPGWPSVCSRRRPSGSRAPAGAPPPG